MKKEMSEIIDESLKYNLNFNYYMRPSILNKIKKMEDKKKIDFSEKIDDFIEELYERFNDELDKEYEREQLKLNRWNAGIRRTER